MDPTEDDDTTELSEGLRLTDALQEGMAALWRRLKAIKLSLPSDGKAGNSGADESQD